MSSFQNPPFSNVVAARYPAWSPLRIAAGYVVFGLTWIWLSDSLLVWQGIQGPPGFWAAVSKGSLFVLISGALVYWLVCRELKIANRLLAMLDAVVEGTTDAVYVKDQHGKFLLSNRSTARFLGKPVAAVLGCDDAELFGAEAGQRLMEQDREVMAAGCAVTQEDTVAIGGVTRTFLATKAPFRDTGGNVIGVIGISRDITERKLADNALRLERDRMARTMEAAPVVICSLAFFPDGRVAMPFASSQMSTIYGLEPKDVADDFTPALRRIVDEDRATVMQTIRESAKLLTPLRGQYRVNHPDRGVIWVEGHAIPSGQLDGSILWHGYVADITERSREIQLRKEQEQKLYESQERLRLAMSAARMGAWEWDLRNDRVHLSPELLSMLGAENLGTDYAAIAQLIHPDDQEQLEATYLRAVMNSSDFTHDFRIRQPNGEVRWMSNIGRTHTDATGAVALVIGLLQDITERKDAEEERQKLVALIEHSRDFIGLADANGRVTFLNSGARQMIGLEESADIRQLTFTDYVPDHWKEFFLETVIRTVSESGLWQGEMQLRHFQTGMLVDVFRSTFRIPDPAGGAGGFATVARDITKQKRADAAIRESEERYRRLVEVLPEAIFISREGRITYCNAACAQLFGATSSVQLIDMDPMALIHPDFHDRVRRRIATMWETRAPAPVLRQTMLRIDGQEFPVHIVATPITDQGADAILVCLQDLTERERSTELLQSVLASVQDAILTIDEDGRIQLVNQSAENLFGYASSELEGENVSQVLPEPFHEERKEVVGNTRRAGMENVIAIGREVEGRRKDGTAFPAELSVSAFRLNGRSQFTGVVRDISQRKELEAQFLQAQKMEALGRLAGGVAHDFNNILTVIIGYGELLLSDLSENDPRRQFVREIRDSADRATGLTRQLLAFSRKAIVAPQKLNLNQVVEDLSRWMRRVIGEDIDFVVHLDPSLDDIEADRGQLEQMLMNLVVNARDAMSSGGRLTLETRNIEDDRIAGGGGGSRRQVRLTVSDTGSGMTSAVQRKIFDPFFTTKPVGKGTGLGLAVVHGIVQQCDGQIRVESAVGVGTTFEVDFPAASPEVTAAEFHPSREVILAGSETILLVEDEIAVRKIARLTLASQGYHVLEAADGPDAMHLAEEYRETIHLLVTDVVMPGLGGRLLAENLRQQRPELRVLFMSGYTDDEVLRHGVEVEADALLQKPFTAFNLTRKVREVLDGKG